MFWYAYSWVSVGCPVLAGFQLQYKIFVLVPLTFHPLEDQLDQPQTVRSHRTTR